MGQIERVRPNLEGIAEREPNEPLSAWIGDDFFVKDKDGVVLNPGEEKEIEVSGPETAFPPFGLRGEMWPPPNLIPSVRSRNALIGVDARKPVVWRYAEDDNLTCSIKFKGLGKRPVILRGRVGCFCDLPPELLLTGEELIREVESGANIGITGKEGEDWSLAVSKERSLLNGYELDPGVAGIRLYLRRARWEVTPDPDDKPIDVSDPGPAEYRRFLTEQKVFRLLKPVEPASFWVTRTRARLNLPSPDINCLLGEYTFGEIPFVHTSSHLVKGGQTSDWEICCEINDQLFGFSNRRMPQDYNYNNESVLLLVFKNRG